MRKLFLMTLLGIFLPVFLFLVVGCMKVPEINKDFGPENTVDQLQTVINSAHNTAVSPNISKIKLGEFSYYVKTNQIENLYPFVFRQEADTITGQDATAQRIKFTITHQVTKLNDTGQLKPDPPTQSEACLELAPNGCQSLELIAKNFLKKIMSIVKMFDIFTIKAMPTSVAETLETLKPDFGINNKVLSEMNVDSIVQRADSSTGTRWTIHNLKSVTSSFPVPELVLMRADCGKRDLKTKKCEDPLETIEVTFDQVDWTTETYPVKYSYKISYSKEVPFFGSQIQNCGSTTMAYAGQRIALMQCETLKDFTYGHD